MSEGRGGGGRGTTSVCGASIPQEGRGEKRGRRVIRALICSVGRIVSRPSALLFGTLLSAAGAVKLRDVSKRFDTHTSLSQVTSSQERNALL